MRKKAKVYPRFRRFKCIFIFAWLTKLEERNDMFKMPTKKKRSKRNVHKNIIKCNSSGIFFFFLYFRIFFLVEKPNRFYSRYLML